MRLPLPSSSSTVVELDSGENSRIGTKADDGRRRETTGNSERRAVHERYTSGMASAVAVTMAMAMAVAVAVGTYCGSAVTSRRPPFAERTTTH